MRQHPNICFEVDDMKDLANWRSVIVQATFEELLGVKKQEAMDFFLQNMQSRTRHLKRLSAYGMVDFHKREQEGIRSVVFRLRPTDKSGRFEKQRWMLKVPGTTPGNTFPGRELPFLPPGWRK